MSVRRDKTLRIVRYLTGHTGIPNISWTGPGSLLTAPFPYSFDMSTERSYYRMYKQMIEAADRKGIATVIRYDNTLDGPANAWAMIRLETYCELLNIHYEANHKGRGE